MARLKPWEVSDELWAVIEPLLPERKRWFRHPGRKRLDDRHALQGILFVLHTGIAWEHLPQEPGYGSGMTCWRRPAEWNASGFGQRLHEVLLNRLRATDALDFSRAAVDSSRIRALKGGADRARPRSIEDGPVCKHHLITEATSIPAPHTAPAWANTATSSSRPSPCCYDGVFPDRAREARG